MRLQNNPAIDVDTIATSAGTLQVRLVLGCDFVTRKLLNSLLSPIVYISTGLKPFEKKDSHIAKRHHAYSLPNAQPNTRCHTSI